MTVQQWQRNRLLHWYRLMNLVLAEHGINTLMPKPSTPFCTAQAEAVAAEKEMEQEVPEPVEPVAEAGHFKLVGLTLMTSVLLRRSPSAAGEAQAAEAVQGTALVEGPEVRPALEVIYPPTEEGPEPEVQAQTRQAEVAVVGPLLGITDPLALLTAATLLEELETMMLQAEAAGRPLLRLEAVRSKAAVVVEA